MNLQDHPPSRAVGRLHSYATVKAPGAQQRVVENLRPVGGAEHDHGLVALKAVHLGQDLIERLLALVVRPRDRGRPLPGAPDRVELVDEDDRRSGLLRFREQIAYARGADTDDRLDELRSRDREERGVRFTSDRAREQRLAGARRSGQEYAVRHPPPETFVALGAAQEVDDLGQLGLGLVDPGDIVEGDADLLGIDATRLGAAEIPERAHSPAGRRPPREQHEQPDDQQRRAEAEQDLGQQRRPLRGRLRVDLNPLRLQQCRQRGVVPKRRHLGREQRRRGRLGVGRRVADLGRERAVDRVALRGDRLHLAGLDLLEEIGAERHLHARLACRLEGEH